MVVKKERLAVGAIVKYKGELVLVKKVMMMDANEGAREIEPEWDFPRGGVKPHEVNFECALARELHEELSINDFRIVKALPDFVFTFDEAVKQAIGFDRQRTKMFLISSTTPVHEMISADNEIDEIRSFSYTDAVNIMAHETSREYLQLVWSEGEH